MEEKEIMLRCVERAVDLVICRHKTRLVDNVLKIGLKDLVKDTMNAADDLYSFIKTGKILD